MMYNILVADDDADIRAGIIGMIESGFGERTRTFQCANGKEAVELACGEHVDVIVADIKMPVCDGIEMMRRLQELSFQGEIMVVSGFGDYDYVRQAMKLGAEDYILKPIDMSEFTALLENCLHRAALKKREGEPRPAYLEHAVLEQQYQLKRLLEGEAPPGTGRWERLAMVALDCAGMSRKLRELEKLSLFTQVEEMVAECPGARECRSIQGESGTLWAVALLAPREALAVAMSPFLERLRQAGMRFGAAASPMEPEQGRAAWQAAVTGLERLFYNIASQVEPDQEYPFPGVMRAAIEAACNDDGAAMDRELYRLFGLLAYRKVPVEEVRQLLATLIYDIMTADGAFVGIVGRYKFTENDFIQAVQEAGSASAMREGAAQILNLYLEKRREKRQQAPAFPENDDYTVQRVLRLIEEGYCTDISLTSISQKLDLHPNYLSTLFRQKTGTTYGQYLRHVRVEKAKELIRQTGLKLYTVAEQVGYRDSAHFYRVFKEETGMSPAKYKKLHGDRTGA